MGLLLRVKCDCGYYRNNFKYGANMAYPRVRMYQTELAKSGRYGKQWKELLNNDSELFVNAQYRLYQCPSCHKLVSKYCMDLYKPSKEDRAYYTPAPDEVIHQYKHICPNCKKIMVCIPYPDQPVFCPKCGKTVITSIFAYTD